MKFSLTMKPRNSFFMDEVKRGRNYPWVISTIPPTGKFDPIVYFPSDERLKELWAEVCGSGKYVHVPGRFPGNLASAWNGKLPILLPIRIQKKRRDAFLRLVETEMDFFVLQTTRLGL